MRLKIKNINHPFFLFKFFLAAVKAAIIAIKIWRAVFWKIDLGRKYRVRVYWFGDSWMLIARRSCFSRTWAYAISIARSGAIISGARAAITQNASCRTSFAVILTARAHPERFEIGASKKMSLSRPLLRGATWLKSANPTRPRSRKLQFSGELGCRDYLPRFGV
jgi:hypothetical protein